MVFGPAEVGVMRRGPRAWQKDAERDSTEAHGRFRAVSENKTVVVPQRVKREDRADRASDVGGYIDGDCGSAGRSEVETY